MRDSHQQGLKLDGGLKKTQWSEGQDQLQAALHVG